MFRVLNPNSERCDLSFKFLFHNKKRKKRARGLLREREREKERKKESEKNMESARDGGDENGKFEENGFEEEDGDENREGRGKITSFLQRSLTKRFAKLLEKTEERVERLERKTEEQRKREEELTESFAEKFRNLVKHVNGKLGDIRGRVSFVGGDGGKEGDGGSAAKPKGIDEDDGTNTRGGNENGASGVAALNNKELEEVINRMVEQKVKEMLMEELSADCSSWRPRKMNLRVSHAPNSSSFFSQSMAFLQCSSPPPSRSSTCTPRTP